MKNRENMLVVFVWLGKMVVTLVISFLLFSFFYKLEDAKTPEIVIEYADGTIETLNTFEGNKIKLKRIKGTSWYINDNEKLTKLVTNKINESCKLQQLYNSKVTFKNDNFTIQINTKDLEKQTIFEYCVSRYDVATNYLIDDLSDAVFNNSLNQYEIYAERELYEVIDSDDEPIVEEDVVLEFGGSDNDVPTPDPVTPVEDDEKEIVEIEKDKISDFTNFSSSVSYSMSLKQIPENYDIGLSSGNVDYTVNNTSSNFKDRVVFGTTDYSLVYNFGFDALLNGNVKVDYTKKTVSTSISLKASTNYVNLSVSLVKKGENTIKKTLQCDVETSYEGTIANNDGNLEGMIERNVSFVYKNVKVLTYKEYIYPSRMKGEGGLTTTADVDFVGYGAVRIVTNGLFDSIEGTTSSTFTSHLSSDILIKVSTTFKIKSFSYNLETN